MSTSFALPHLPLDLTFEESQKLLQQLRTQKSFAVKDTAIAEAIKGGEKLSNWIKLINSQRSESEAIRLTNKETQTGIPIDQAHAYGPSTIKSGLAKLRSTLPIKLSQVIYGKAAISEQTLVSEQEFILWGRKVSKLYQTAVRWTSLSPYLGQYARRKVKDIRGYYHLKNISQLDNVLANYRQLNSDELEQLKTALIGICINSFLDEKMCDKELQKSLARNDLLSYKNTYWSDGKDMWDSFFIISNPRKDVVWSHKAPAVMQVVFKDPKNEKIATWLKENVEDEFKYFPENWQMEMNFIRGRLGSPYIQFQKNVVPHVSGGNKIVMDANTELEEYDVRWTIRHEFGHILRLPDCYHEFYDEKQKLMINYQIDTSDLMCSRKGAMNKRIYEELKKVYFK